MGLKERIYSVLVVSVAESFNSALTSMLPSSIYNPIVTANSISMAKRLISEQNFDFVLINSPLPDDMGIHFAINASASKGTVVLLLVKSEIHGEINSKVSEYGVFTLAKPTSKATISQAFSWMISARERLRGFEKKTFSIEDKMEEIRIVNRAKWVLINELKMDEPSAHRYIEKQAMDTCVSKKEIAMGIIKAYSSST